MPRPEEIQQILLISSTLTSGVWMRLPARSSLHRPSVKMENFSACAKNVTAHLIPEKENNLIADVSRWMLSDNLPAKMASLSKSAASRNTTKTSLTSLSRIRFNQSKVPAPHGVGLFYCLHFWSLIRLKGSLPFHNSHFL